MASIYIDMDDVLTQSNLTFLTVLEREFGKKADYSQITTFDLQQSFGLSDAEYAHFFHCIHTPDEMIQQAPVPGARQVLRFWHDKGHKISIVTGRPLHTREVSLEWLNQHQMIHDSFAIVNKYGRNSSEGEMALSLDDLRATPFDLAVEDSGQMAQFLSETMGVTVALMDRPWNRSLPFNALVNRCADWMDVQQIFKRV